MNDTKNVFTDIYKTNKWGSKESVSGSGSTLEATQKLRQILPIAFSCLGVKSIVDAPCGDRNWMPHVPYEFAKYVGVDVVQELVDRHRVGKTKNQFFQVNDITTDILPVADAIFCRDCLGHLPFELALDAVRLFKISKAKYLFTTTFPNVQENINIRMGEWYPINLQLPPFSLGAPVCVINEDTTYDKHIGVWKLEE